MKKRLMSLLLAAVMTVTSVPAVNAAGGFDFMEPVRNELPVQAGVFLDETPILPEVGGTDFIKTPSGAFPEVRKDGFLAEPSAPLKTFPEDGLMAEVTAPDENAIEIDSIDDIAQMAKGGSYVLTADLDFSGVDWEPLGVNKDLVLDGQGHTISGLTSDEDDYFAGLFGSVSGSLTARNLILRDFSFVRGGDMPGTTPRAGALAASVRSLCIENCVLDGFNVTATADGVDLEKMGGFVGNVSSGSSCILRDCAVRGSIDLSTDADAYAYAKYVGGMVGYWQCKSFEAVDCLTEMDITFGNCGTYQSGGMVGSISAGGEVSMLRCVASGNVSGEIAEFSGLALVSANRQPVTLRDCLFNGSIELTGTEESEVETGGLAASILGQSVQILNCRSEGTISTKKGGIGGLVGYLNDRGTCTIIRDCLAAGDIMTGLQEFSEMGSGGLIGRTSFVFLMEDCLAIGAMGAMDGEELTSKVGGLIGSAKGDNSTLLRCVSECVVSGQRAGGLVGEVTGSAPLTFEDCTSTSTVTGKMVSDYDFDYIHSAAGGLLGKGSSTFQNCTVSGTIKGDCAGGLLGETYDDSMKVSSAADCRVDCTVDGQFVGGLFGLCDPGYYNTYVTFTNCAVEVDMISEPEYDQVFGGLLGQGQGDAERCQTVVNIVHTGDRVLTAGGLVGENIGEVVLWDSKSTFTVDDRSSKNGILGGILGTTKDYGDVEVLITNCVSEVDISAGVRAVAGGIAGTTIGIMTRCTATGNIEATQNGQINSVDWPGLGGLIGIGQNLTVGECCASVDLNAKNAATYIGGLIGAGPGSSLTVYSCWSDADISFVQTNADHSVGGSRGGLIGASSHSTTASLAMQDCCFLGTIRGQLGNGAGGIVGEAYKGIIRNCYAITEISGTGLNLPNISEPESYTGGIAGRMRGTIQNCYVEGTVKDEGGVVGGIVGNDDTEVNSSMTVTNCNVKGTVVGNCVGGIVGDITGMVRDCTFDGTIGLGNVDHHKFGDSHYLGGIAATVAGTISDCAVEQRLSISKVYDGGEDHRFTPSVYLGGIAGSAGRIGNCTSKGASARITGARVVNVGGIAAAASNLDCCTVNGGVLASLVGIHPETLIAYEAVNAGGLIAYGGKIRMGNCTVNGSVTGALSRSHSEMSYELNAGGLVGKCTKLSPEACSFNGALIYPSGLGNLSNKKYPPFLGSGEYEGAVAPEVVLPERKEEDYKITVYGYTAQDVFGYLLPKANITVNGKGIGRTNEFGEFLFSSKDLDQHGLNTITVSCDGYFDATHYTYLAREGEQTFYLKKKEPGQIYFETVQYQGEYRANLLNRLDSVTLLQQDTKRKNLEVKVDWNDIDEEDRDVYLINGTGNRKYGLQDDSVNAVGFTTFFKPEDDIYIVAKGTYQGEPVELKEKLALSIRAIDIDIKMAKGRQQIGSSSEADEDKNLYFLQGLNMNVGLGDLVPFASEISILNEQLQLKFTWKQGQSDTMDFWELASGTGTLKEGVDVFIEGTIKIPVTDAMEGEWSGDLTFGINQLPDINYDERVTDKLVVDEMESDGLMEITIPLPLPVPSYFETKIGVGGSGTLRIYGPYDKVNVAAKVTASGYGQIGIGLGGAVDDNLEVKVGGEGELRADMNMVSDPAAGKDLTIEPVIDGAVSAKASLKAYIINGEVKLKLGGFHWDKEKLQWFALGNEGVEPMMVDDFGTEWQAVDRRYLANGGGFNAADAALWSFRTEAGAKVRYDNIALTADTALTLNRAGNAVLYYTADDESAGTNGTVAEHTALWMSERAADGSWSEPVQLSTEGAYPAVPHANGDYVIWVESEETDTLDEMLTSSVIKLAKNGKVVATYDPGCYVYDPQVAASPDGSTAVISWMKDSEVSGENVLGGSPELCYAAFDGTSIGKLQTKKDASSATLVYNSTVNDAVIRYRDESGALYRNYSNILTAPLKHYATDGYTTVNIDENGKLTVYNSRNEVESYETAFTQNGSPVLVTDPDSYQKYVFWAEDSGIRCIKGSGDSWSEPMMVTTTNAAAAQLAVVVDADGIPHLSWLETTVDEDGAERTDLYTMAFDPAGIDLVLQEISYDEEHLLSTGEIKLVGKVYNNSMNAAEGMQITITDESGATVYTNAVDRAVNALDSAYFYAVFAPDGKSAHTYTVSVEPIMDDEVVTDTDTSDNTLEVGVAAGKGEIVDLGFVQTTVAKTVTLEAFVRNTGGAMIDSMQVTVTNESGETVAEETFTDLPFGSTGQILMPSVTANERYTVTVKTDGEVTDERTMVYTDPDAPRLNVSAFELSGKTAELTLRGQGQTEGEANVMLALYQNGKMRYAAEDKASSLNGSHALEFEFEKAPAKGTYDYKIFFLADDDTHAPLATARNGSVTVE